MKLVIKTINEEETKRIGETLAKLLFSGSIILLTGDLGAGKTTLTKGIAKGLNINEIVNSPTFNILKCYFSGDKNLYHIDAYRLEDVDPENKNIGLEEVIEGDGVAVIEWPMFISEFIPNDHLEINIKRIDEFNREISIIASGNKYDLLIKELEDKLCIA